jgi:hypothetical protein
VIFASIATECVQKKYGEDSYRDKVMKQKLNQKCHDAGKRVEVHQVD